MMRIAAALLLVATLPACAHSDRGDATRTLQVDGKSRSYVLHLPPADAKGPHPLLLLLHGGGGRGRGMLRLTGIADRADRAGFILAMPDGIDRHWNDGRATIRNPQDDIGFIAALIDRIERDYPVDRSRVAVAGISNGAIFAQRIGCDLAGRVGAIAAIAGTLASDYASHCRPARPVSVLQFGGTDDPIMPYAGGKVADFGGRGEGGNVLSVDDTVAFWSRADGCAGLSAAQPLPSPATSDPTRVTLRTGEHCRAGSALQLYSIHGGGHTWPGGLQYLPALLIGRTTRQIDAGDIIVRFVLDHPRR
ncbi:MAG: esterase [Proteobacteria bacterium]|nr:esterase [Pseudomonadota bacterium]